jgi:aminoglycoside phosphotransferase (APT) family kinase protein
MPRAEVLVDEALARRLLREQQPALAERPVRLVANGWDNAVFAVGEELLARFPRRAASVASVTNEQRWLPVLAPRLPLPVPSPVYAGVPGSGYPWPWSVVAFFPGQVAALAEPSDPTAAARALAWFLACLHRPAPSDAPANPHRGGALHRRGANFHENLSVIGPGATRSRLLETWADAVAAPVFRGPPVWLHGDLHPANIVVDSDKVSAIIDFGDLTSGDPATDLAVPWMMLPPTAHRTFWDTYLADARYPVDEHLMRRARGWAASLGLVFCAHSADNPLMAAVGRRTIETVVGTAMG